MHGGFSKDPILLLKVLLEGCYEGCLESKGEMARTSGCIESKATVLGVIRGKGHCLNHACLQFLIQPLAHSRHLTNLHGMSILMVDRQ